MINMNSVWSIDDITPNGMLPIKDRDLFLIKLVHLNANISAGIRYLLVRDGLIDIKNNSASKLSFGQSYSFDEDALKSFISSYKFGPNKKKIPILRGDTIGGYVYRRKDIEADLQDKIEYYYKRAKVNIMKPEQDPRIPKIRNKGIQPRSKLFIFNVGQGDTILLELQGGELWLIDAYFWRKETYDSFKRWIKERYRTIKLTRLIISHFHYDHIRYAAKVVEDFEPKEVIVDNSYTHKTGAAQNLLNICDSRGILKVLDNSRQMRLGDDEIKLIRTNNFPGSHQLSPDPNEHAIALCIKTINSLALLSADIPGWLLESLVTNGGPASSKLPNKIYKVTHHCSLTGDHDPFLNEFLPTRAATSCALKNRYGFPHDPPRSKINRLTNYLHDITYTRPLGCPITYELV